MQKNIVARLFLVSPLWVMYFFHQTHSGRPAHEQMDFSTLLMLSGGMFALLAWKDYGRAPRSSISVIIRNMAMMFCVVCSVFLLFGFPWSMWYMMSHAYTWFFVLIQKILSVVASNTIYPMMQSNYKEVLKTGWHPYWDTTVFNYDSDLIKNGGFEEPVYTNFVPPDDWEFQCPSCGARQQTNFGVCWNCNYGADGDDTAYQDRWGHLDPNPPRPYNGPTEEPEPPTSSGEYIPIEPRR